MKKSLRLGIFAAILAALSACGAKPATSDTKYIPLDPGYEGLLGHIKDQQITICINGYDRQDQWATWTHDDVLKWIEPLRGLSTKPLVTNVVLVEGSDDTCSEANAQVNLYDQDFRAYTEVGSRPVVNVSRQDAREGHVILHELGHAFGMGDTYSDGGDTGQPDSVMKTAEYSQLQPDDIAGIQYLYKRLYGNAFERGPITKPYVTVVPQ